MHPQFSAPTAELQIRQRLSDATDARQARAARTPYARRRRQERDEATALLVAPMTVDAVVPERWPDEALVVDVVVLPRPSHPDAGVVGRGALVTTGRRS